MKITYADGHITFMYGCLICVIASAQPFLKAEIKSDHKTNNDY